MITLFRLSAPMAALLACGNLYFGGLTFLVLFVAGGVVVAQLRG